MPITENEALAGLRVLVAIARADGSVHNDERRSLAAAIESLELPAGTSIEQLLAEEVDLEAQLRVLVSAEAREQIYRSAFFMAHADGTCTDEEAVLLDRIAVATGTSAEQRAALDRLFVGPPSSVALAIKPLAEIPDPEKRAAEVNRLALSYAVLTAALGAFPIPGLAIATDLAVVALQLKMIRDVGALWGHVVDKSAAKSILYGLGLGTGARLAVNNLAKLVPGWGSVVGATTSFVSTYALATVIENVFGGDAIQQQPDAEALRAKFRAAEEAARAVYADQQDVIIASRRDNAEVFATLTAELKAGRLTQSEFDAAVTAIVG